MVVERTPKAVTLTITVERRDDGMITVNRTPINRAPGYDAAQGWLGAANIILGHIGILGPQRSLAAEFLVLSQTFTLEMLRDWSRLAQFAAQD
jgi:hypothetical protein